MAATKSTPSSNVFMFLINIFFVIPSRVVAEATTYASSESFDRGMPEPSPVIAKKTALMRHEPGYRKTVGGSFSPTSPPPNSSNTGEAHDLPNSLPASACTKMLDALSEVLMCAVGFAVAVTIQKMLRQRAKHPRLHNKRGITGLFNGQQTQKAVPTKRAGVLTMNPLHQALPSGKRTEESTSMPRDDPAARNQDDRAVAVLLQSEIKSLVFTINRGRAEKLPQLIDEALLRIERKCASHDSCERHAEELLTNIMRACASYGLYSDALAAYDCVSKRIGRGDRTLWSLLLYVISEAGDYSRGKHIYSRIQSMAMPSGNDLINLIRCLANERNLEGLEQTLTDLKESQEHHVFDNVIRNKALSACCKAGAHELAEAVARSDVFSGPPDAVAYNTLMTCFARESQFAQLFNLYEEMKAQNVKRTQVTFGVLIDACVSAGDFDRSRSVLQEMSACGIQANAVHCTSIIKGLINAGRITEAEKMFSDMLVSQSAKPDIITYSTLLKAYAEQGNVKAALRIFEGMRDQRIRPDEIICNVIFSACAVHPLSGSEIQSIFDRVCSACELKPSTITLSIMLKAFSKAKAWQSALTFLRSVPDRFSVKPELRLYLQLAQDCVKVDGGAMVLDIHDTMVQQARRFGEDVDEMVSKRMLRHCSSNVRSERANHVPVAKAGNCSR